MRERQRSLVLAVTATVLAVGSFRPSAADFEPSQVALVGGTDAMVGVFWDSSHEQFLYSLLAEHVSDGQDQYTRIVMTRNVALIDGIDRVREDVAATASALQVDWASGRASLNAAVGRIGLVSLTFQYYGANVINLNPTCQYGWIGWGLVSSSDHVAVPPHVAFSGTINGVPIALAFCQSLATDLVGGFWYSI
jgi:hypothetical protein